MQPSLEDGDRLSPLVWKVSSIAVLGSLMSQLDATIVNVSLSSLATELHTSLSVVQWVTSGYLLALALMLPLSAWLVSRIGARAVYLWSFGAFTATSALCGMAWSAHSLILMRVFQGIAGGLLAPMAQMMMASVAGKHMARLMGYAALAVMLGPLFGPVLAGVILQHASWRWLFLVNVPVGIVALILAVFFLPGDQHEREPRSLDVLGLALISPGLALFLFGIDHAGTKAGASCIAIALVLLTGFIWSSKTKGEDSIVDLELMQKSVFLTASAIQFLSNGISFAGQMLLPLIFIRAWGYSPVAAGAALAPQALGMLIMYPLMGRLTHRFGSRKVAFVGGALALAATLPVLYMLVHPPQRGAVIAALFIRGLGLASIGIPSISAAYTSVPKRDIPMATTTLNITQRLGGPTLTTLCATLFAWRLQVGTGASGMVHAFFTALAFLAALHLLVTILAMGLPGIAKPENEQVYEEVLEEIGSSALNE